VSDGIKSIGHLAGISSTPAFAFWEEMARDRDGDAVRLAYSGQSTKLSATFWATITLPYKVLFRYVDANNTAHKTPIFVGDIARTKGLVKVV
jgi:hypothetical protein